MLHVKHLLRCLITIWCTSSSRCHKQWRFRMQKAAVDREWKKLETIPAWQLEKVKRKKEVILEAQRDKKIHFATLVDKGHHTNAESEQIYRSIKVESCFRGDSFYWQGSSASQMTAAKIMDVVERLPGCEGQAADAVSACTSGKVEGMLPDCSKIPKSECPDVVWISLPRHKWPKSWANIEDLVVPWTKFIWTSHWQDCYWTRQSRKKLLWELEWEKSTK